MVFPKVSVVLPTFNRADWLAVSIGSVLRQSFTDWELIVVDDRSEDETKEVVAHYAAQDARIIYLPNERAQGPSGARNHGIDHARGTYIALLDSDDEWESFHLQRMVEYLDAFPDLIHVMTANPLRKRRSTGEIVKYDTLDLKRFTYGRIRDAYLLDSDTLFDHTVRGHRILTTQTIVARRRVFEEIPWAEGVGAGEDCLFPIAVAHRKFRVAHLQDFHVTYWMHDDNLTNTDGRRSADRMIPVYEGFKHFYLNVLADFPLDTAQKRFISRKLADHLVWNLGYNGYLKASQFDKSRQCFISGIRLRPMQLSYWKAYLSSFGKQLINFMVGRVEGEPIPTDLSRTTAEAAPTHGHNVLRNANSERLRA